MILELFQNIRTPAYDTFYPDIEQADPAQQKFYKWLLKEFKRGRAPDIQDNLSYLFVFIYDLINNFVETRDYKQIAKWFDFLRSNYEANTKIGSYLNIWQGDAALLVENWQDAWEYHRRERLSVNFIVNVRKRCNETYLAASDLNALLMSDNGITESGRQRINEINKEADKLLNSYQELNGLNLIDKFCEEYARRELNENELEQIVDDCGYLISDRKLKNAYKRQPGHKEYQRSLFSGALMKPISEQDAYIDKKAGFTISTSFEYRNYNPTVSMISVSPAIEMAIIAQCKQLLREAENIVRERAGLPRVGEGWVSETELFILLRDAFKETKVLQHARPDWLSPQHLDVYFPQYKVGVEYQGSQHINPIDYFGGEKALEQQKRRDSRKRRLCKKYGCQLIEVYQGYNKEVVVEIVRNAILKVQTNKLLIG